jgi:hypothetical protein
MAGTTNHIAQSFTDDVYAGNQPLMAGDTPPMATRDVLIPAALAAIPQYTPLGYAAGAYKVWAVADGAVAAVAAYAIPDSASDQRAAVYTAGMFNIDAIAWPGGTTEAQVQTAQANSQLQFRKLLYSDKRTTATAATVGEASHAPTVG